MLYVLRRNEVAAVATADRQAIVALFGAAAVRDDVPPTELPVVQVAPRDVEAWVEQGHALTRRRQRDRARQMADRAARTARAESWTRDIHAARRALGWAHTLAPFLLKHRDAVIAHMTDVATPGTNALTALSIIMLHTWDAACVAALTAASEALRRRRRVQSIVAEEVARVGVGHRLFTSAEIAEVLAYKRKHNCVSVTRGRYGWIICDDGSREKFTPRRGGGYHIHNKVGQPITSAYWAGKHGSIVVVDEWVVKDGDLRPAYNPQQPPHAPAVTPRRILKDAALERAGRL
ncbi:hypothetical protein [Azospirillum sp. sgz302134]